MNASRQLVPAFILPALFAAVAFGQTQSDVERVIRLEHATTSEEVQQIATLTRAMTEVHDIRADAGSITLRGSAEQVALAEWLVREADKPAGFRAEPREHAIPGSGETLRVFNLADTDAPQSLQEVATVVRSITEMRRLFTYPKAKALAVRGGADQLKLAEWLIGELDRPASQTRSDSALFSYAAPDDTVRVFYLTPGESPRQLQDVAVSVRKTAGVRRLFTYNAPRAMVVRGTATQIARAEQLIQTRAR
ncbi:MAG: hypothetical protein U0Q16_14745 [Bryobacteraceae bacterium]